VSADVPSGAVRRVDVKQPEELLALAARHSEQLRKPIDLLYAEAIERYIVVTKHATAGSLRSRAIMPRTSPYVTIELPEELFERADALAERLEKKRDVLYAEALAKALAKLETRAPSADSALDQGHDLPRGAWRDVKST
jgi:predicted transcriptional regulator